MSSLIVLLPVEPADPASEFAFALTPDGRTLIVAESYGQRLTAFDVAADGSLQRRRVWAQFGGRTGPDGICLDAEGAVWIASPVSREVLRVREGGEITDRIATTDQAIACAAGRRGRPHALRAHRQGDGDARAITGRAHRRDPPAARRGPGAVTAPRCRPGKPNSRTQRAQRIREGRKRKPLKFSLDFLRPLRSFCGLCVRMSGFEAFEYAEPPSNQPLQHPQHLLRLRPVRRPQHRRAGPA